MNIPSRSLRYASMAIVLALSTSCKEKKEVHSRLEEWEMIGSVNPHAIVPTSLNGYLIGVDGRESLIRKGAITRKTLMNGDKGSSGRGGPLARGLWETFPEIETVDGIDYQESVSSIRDSIRTVWLISLSMKFPRNTSIDDIKRAMIKKFGPATASYVDNKIKPYSYKLIYATDSIDRIGIKNETTMQCTRESHCKISNMPSCSDKKSTFSSRFMSIRISFNTAVIILTDPGLLKEFPVHREYDQKLCVSVNPFPSENQT